MQNLIAAILRGAAVSWPAEWGPAEQAQFLHLAAHHGVQPLLAYGLRQAGTLGVWPRSVEESLIRALRVEVAREALRTRELTRVLTALARAAIPVLMMKGSGLAYVVYPHPFLRPRGDTDLLVHPRDITRVAAALKHLGYQQVGEVAGTLATHEVAFARREGVDSWHLYDVHSRVAAPLILGAALPFEALVDRSAEVPGLGTPARTLSRTDALLAACVHRVVHHPKADSLLWLYDVHLLADGMDDRTFACFAALAAKAEVQAICAAELMLAQQRFSTRLADAAAKTLSRDGVKERTRFYLFSDRRRVTLLLADLQTLGTWAARGQLLRERLFPPAAYMFARYGWTSRLALPALYAHRILFGARRWFQKEDRGLRTEGGLRTEASVSRPDGAAGARRGD